MEKLAEHLRGALAPAAPLATARFCVAFSGGLDSTALLMSLARLRDETGCGLRAIHVNHGLHPEAGNWARHCVDVAGGLVVACQVRAVTVSVTAGRGLEAAARDARYQAFRELLEPGEWLLMAHQADDQVETVLLHLARGSGVQGLGGIPRMARLGKGWLLRPFLDLPRRDLEACVVEARLPWLEDPLNSNPRLDRNHLRCQVLPPLRVRWPAIARAAGRSATLAAEAAGLLDELAAADATLVGYDGSLSLTALRAMGEARQRNLIRHLSRLRGWAVPPEARLREGLAQLLTAGPDRGPVVRWPGGEIRRYRDRLYLLDDGAVVPQVAVGPWEWNPEAPLDLGPPRGALRLVPAGEGLAAAAVAGPLTVGVRDSPGVGSLAGARATLKRVFQARGVVPWMRPHVPLIWRQGRLLAIGDLWYAPAARARAGEPAIRLAWVGHGPLG